MVAVLFLLALCVGQLPLRLRIHVRVVGGTLVHKCLYRPVQQQIQPAEQNQEVEEHEQHQHQRVVEGQGPFGLFYFIHR